MSLQTARWKWIVLGSGALAALTLGGCPESDRECYPSDWRACECEGEVPGYQQCDTEGSDYGACDCSGMIPGLTTSAGSAGSGGEGGAGGGGDKLPFMSECETDDQCDTGLCFPFNAKGPHCSKPCDSDDDCPPPSTGCNNMGVCKAP